MPHRNIFSKKNKTNKNNKADNKDYLELIIEDNYTTKITLGDKELDYEKIYDIKIPSGKEFEACEIYKETHHSEGMGGMSESSTTITLYFIIKEDGLEIKLKSGYLMRVNEKATYQKQDEKTKAEKEQQLKNLYNQREALESKISKLEN